MSLDELLGSLQTFEACMKLKAKNKGLALKVVKEASSSDDDEEMALLVKKFRKFMRKGAKPSGKYSMDKEVKKSFTPPHERSGHDKSNRKLLATAGTTAKATAVMAAVPTAKESAAETGSAAPLLVDLISSRSTPVHLKLLCNRVVPLLLPYKRFTSLPVDLISSRSVPVHLELLCSRPVSLLLPYRRFAPPPVDLLSSRSAPVL
ncbi:hypothetical protein LWI29_006553 [Acer saccharum]|uniref:UBN2 domain-containing protein n=1 Tax=Acer saccharum TaxID=4024 RepID=A0AA39VMM2_ACESA|nr:hypothetical protein LWI29_006553 [Acer saccharum]